MLKVELQEEIGKALPHIVECLESSSSYVCCAAVEALSSLGAYCMCPFVSPLLVS
jgi:hypothetical protein